LVLIQPLFDYIGEPNKSVIVIRQAQRNTSGNAYV